VPPQVTDRDYSYDAYGTRLAMTKDPDGANPAHYTYGYDVHGSVSSSQPQPAA
jgi:hypothetical protein